MGQDFDDLVEQAKEEWVERFASGPKRVRWSELPPQIGDRAPDLELQDTSRRQRRLSEFWTDGPALLLFWRHFGCDVGVERAEQLAEAYDEYLDAGASVAIVNEAEPERAAAYADEYDIKCPILCDPDGNAHETYGLLDYTLAQDLYGLPHDFIEYYHSSPDEFAENAVEEGVDDRPNVDNPWQQPGDFVVDEDGVLRLTIRHQYAGDHPDPNVLVAAIREASG